MRNSALHFAFLLPMAFARLYYPPILSPKAGDIIPVGSLFTVVWNTTIPHGIDPQDVANSTSEVRIGNYFPAAPPEQPYPVAYLFFHIDDLNPPPNPQPGWLQPLDFYRNVNRPGYTRSGYGWAQFKLNENLCGTPTQHFAVGWFDANGPQELSGPFTTVGDCITG